MTSPSLVRESIDWLLDHHPGLDVVAIDWQIARELPYPNDDPRLAPPVHNGVWVLVEIGQPSDAFDDVPAWAVWSFAILKTTGALYRRGVDGVVPDEPIYEPQKSGGGRNKPVPSTYDFVGSLLRDMAAHVEAGDSFEGSIEYLMPDVPDWAQRGEPKPDDHVDDEVLVRAAYRIGNSQGQGGYRIVGSINSRDEP